MREIPEINPEEPDEELEEIIDSSIRSADEHLYESKGEELGGFIAKAMVECGNDTEQVVAFLLEKRVFQHYGNPEALARAAVEKYLQHGEKLYEHPFIKQKMLDNKQHPFFELALWFNYCRAIGGEKPEYREAFLEMCRTASSKPVADLLRQFADDPKYKKVHRKLRSILSKLDSETMTTE